MHHVSSYQLLLNASLQSTNCCKGVVILTIFQRRSYLFSLFFSNEATSEEEGSWDAQRYEEEERNRKNKFKGKFVFSSMSIFNEVYRKINKM